MIIIKQSQAVIHDRMEGTKRLKTYSLIFDWEEGNLILAEVLEGQDIFYIRRTGKILASSLLPEQSVEIEISVRVKES